MLKIKHKLITLLNWDLSNSFMGLSFFKYYKQFVFVNRTKEAFLTDGVEVEWADNKGSIKTSLEKALQFMHWLS